MQLDLNLWGWIPRVQELRVQELRVQDRHLSCLGNNYHILDFAIYLVFTITIEIVSTRQDTISIYYRGNVAVRVLSKTL